MPNDSAPSWFDADYYAQQKVNQMNATSYQMGEGEWFTQNHGTAAAWTVELYNQYLAQYTTPAAVQVGGQTWNANSHVTAYDNFIACNSTDYVTPTISLADINVSPNAMFNIPVYLQNLANYNIANPDAFSGTVPAEGWNMQTELDYIFNTYKASVWDHYNAQWDTLLINPSNEFDTAKYLQLRADAMGPGTTVEQAIAAIKAAGLNPVQDFYEWGRNNGITASSLAVEAGDQTTPGISGWNQWQSGGEGPTETDPYDVNVVPVEIMPGEFSYKGEDGQNTRFEAVWSRTSADNTLNAKDVIDGGTGMNTLAVTLGKDWGGFNGVTVDGQFNPNPSVTHVGRIVLNHAEVNSERSWSFDAKNISDDTVRYDLNGTGTGAISLSNLSSKVERVNISNIKSVDIGGIQDPTTLDFQAGANSGKNDAITIGVKDVCADGRNSESIRANGIENVTIDAMDGSNTINLAAMTGIKNLTVTGAGNLTITDSSSTGIKTYDAHEATGNVNFGVSGLSNQTVAGGTGTDTVTFSGVSHVSRANWTSIENVAFGPGSAGSSLNAKGVEGLQNATFSINSSGAGTITNLDADNFTVYQTKNGSGDNISVNGTNQGSLGNIAWVTQGGSDGADIKADFTSNATGDVQLLVTGEDTIADDSAFYFSKASGKITINNPNAYDGVYTNGITLDANKATALDATWTGSFKSGSSTTLQALQDITLTLTDNSTTSGTHDTFVLDTGMNGAQHVTVNGGAEGVQLGSLGNTTNGTGVDLNVTDVTNFKVGTILSKYGGDINVNIVADNAVELDDIITSTNESANDQGDVSLTVTAQQFGTISGSLGSEAVTTNGAGLQIKGGELNINLSGVEGDIGATGTNKAIALHSLESIHYTGSDTGDDYVSITSVGKNSQSIIDLGQGADSLTIGALGVSGQATIAVDLGSDTDNDNVAITGNTSGWELVQVRGWAGSDNISVTSTSDAVKVTDAAAANAILVKCGLSAMVPEGTTLADAGKYTPSGSNTSYVILGEAASGADQDHGMVVMVVGDDSAPTISVS